jgi:hypothetical protein
LDECLIGLVSQWAQHFGLPTSSARGEDRAMRAASRRLTRSCGQMCRCVTMPKATNLISTLSPKNASICRDRLLVPANASDAPANA